MGYDGTQRVTDNLIKNKSTTFPFLLLPHPVSTHLPESLNVGKCYDVKISQHFVAANLHTSICRNCLIFPTRISVATLPTLILCHKKIQ
jgi:hypothetical protein